MNTAALLHRVDLASRVMAFVNKLNSPAMKPCAAVWCVCSEMRKREYDTLQTFARRDSTSAHVKKMKKGPYQALTVLLVLSR